MRPACVLTLLALLAGACGGDAVPPDEQRATGPVEVVAVNYPLRYFAERIGGDHVRVTLPAEPGEDPAFWSPTAEQVAAVQQADLVLLNGAGYAKWVERATLAPSKVVVTAAGAADRFIRIEGGIVHSHGTGPEHSHAGTAFTTWLDMRIALLQARTVMEALAARRPAQRAAFESAFAGLARDLLALDSEFERVAKAAGGQPLLGSHPVYQYLAQRYGLDLKSVHWEPNLAPGAAQSKQLDALLEGRAAKAMLWEATPRKEMEQMLMERGVGTFVFCPCGNEPQEGDFLTTMEANAKALQAALSR